jgi:hypothetical protein
LTVNTDKANPLRIGLMLHAIDDVDGQGIYIRKLTLSSTWTPGTNTSHFYSDERQAGFVPNTA